VPEAQLEVKRNGKSAIKTAVRPKGKAEAIQ